MVYIAGGVYHSQRIDWFLSANGDGTGSIDGNVNGSSSSVLLKIDSPATGAYAIHRMLVTIRDTGTFTASTSYGAVAAPLSNGIQVGLFDSEARIVDDFTTGNPIKYNSGWGEHCFDVDLKDWGNGPKLILARWTFSNGGAPIYLRAGSGMSFGVLIRDDLSGLEEHVFNAQGQFLP